MAEDEVVHPSAPQAGAPQAGAGPPFLSRLARQPLFWTLLNALLALAYLKVSGRWAAWSDPDTLAYQTMPLDSLTGALSHVRTIGYPLFLAGVRALTGTDLAAPYFQFACYLLAVIAFTLALRSAGFSPGAQGAVGSVLMWSHAMFDFTGFLHPDSLAVSGAIVSMAALLVAVRPAASWAIWMGLAAAIFITCQMRPAYLFLPPLAPCLGLFLAVVVFRVPLTRGQQARLLAALAAAAGGPLLAFCGLRWFVTGHFGLVSFGGYNLIGVSGQWLDAELARELPEDVRPLAYSILTQRAAYEAWEPPDNYYACERMYNPTVWRLAIPAARELYGDDAVRLNNAVGKLARELIYLRPGRYLRWLVWSGREGMRSCLLLFITDKGTRLSLLALLAIQVVLLKRYWKSGAVPESLPSSPQRFLEVNVLVWLALAFAAAKLMLVIAVEVPTHRYLSGAMVFAPPVIALLAWRRGVQAFQSTPTKEPS
jgi:hypothetical protein